MAPYARVRRFSRAACAVVVTAIAATSCAAKPDGTQFPTCEARDDANTQAVRKLVAAFNAHDTYELLLTVDPKIEWYSISGEQMPRELSSARELGIFLGGYFAECPSCQTTLESVCSLGPRVMTYEAASWENESGLQVQRSIAVYEFSRGKVSRVYYFPADADVPPSP